MRKIIATFQYNTYFCVTIGCPFFFLHFFSLHGLLSLCIDEKTVERNNGKQKKKKNTHREIIKQILHIRRIVLNTYFFIRLVNEFINVNTRIY